MFNSAHDPGPAVLTGVQSNLADSAAAIKLYVSGSSKSAVAMTRSEESHWPALALKGLAFLFKLARIACLLNDPFGFDPFVLWPCNTMTLCRFMPLQSLYECQILRGLISVEMFRVAESNPFVEVKVRNY